MRARTGSTPASASPRRSSCPTALAKNANDASDSPFGLWFASPTTLYVADEGSGDNAYDATYAAATSTTAFRTVIAPAFAQVVRGVSFTPGTGVRAHGH